MHAGRANVLTIVFDRPRRQRRVTFTDVRYGLTWNRMYVTGLPGGAERVFDRLDIVGYEARTTHGPTA